MHPKEIWAQYFKRIIGIVAGLLCGIVYLFFGFWDMCFVLVIVLAGYWIGKLNEEEDHRFSISNIFSTIIEYVRKLFRPYR